MNTTALIFFFFDGEASAAEGVTVDGPYCVDKHGAFSAGSSKFGAYSAGATEAVGYSAGSEKSAGNC